MWRIDTYWFDATVATGLLLVGHIVFGRFEDYKPLWRRLLKAALGVAIYLAIAVFLGRVWGYTFIGAIAVGGVVVHGWWLPRNGVNGWTAEPRARYYELIGREPDGRRRKGAS
jgi:hypothetical protein